MSEKATREAVCWVGAESFLSGLKRVNIFCGGYGSGKTEIAVNFALHLAARGKPVKIADLDIVNPYFRSREVREELRRHGIQVLVPNERLISADLPIVMPEIKGAIETGNEAVVLDLGGDPAGARVMASIAQAMPKDDYHGFFVLNSRRPFTRTPAAVAGIMSEISRASGMAITGQVVNSHLIDETAVDVVEEGFRLAEEVSRDTGTGIAFVAVERSMLDRFDAAGCGYPVMVLDRHMLKPWEDSDRLGREKFKL